MINSRTISQRIFILIMLCLVLDRPSTTIHGEEKPAIRIGSKGFTESVILGECLSHLARISGIQVEHRAELGGTQILWKALLAGDIDAYVDYTGTIREELLAEELKAGAEIRSENDMRQLLSKHGVTMSDRIGFNNTYALGMRDSLAAEKQIVRISDLKSHPELKIGVSDEFMERKDGWKQLALRYRLPQKDIRTMDHNLAYRGLERDSIQITDLYTTDAEIDFYRLRILDDDLGYFPTYYAVVLMREDLATRFPEAAKSLLRMENLIDSKSMASMTGKVRLNRELETNVAASFLNKALSTTIPLEKAGMWAEWGRFFKLLGKTTSEHLFLVIVSLTLAIIVAVPLGILSAKNASAGQFILSIVSVIQTLPSMALLVFMIPLFGLGALPAIAALFFYSLLPIVRNTYAGLTQIPKATIESAEVLGLPATARLRLVELPLAMPSILAGVKTAAVINVGTATIGALIGAGGYGAPILTGIRLSSIPLILQGAVPAALLAVAVQFLFSWIERRAVSPGLQQRT